MSRLHPTNHLERSEMNTTLRYPNIKVKLIGCDGNAFTILGAVLRELRHAGVSEEERKEFHAQATSGDYNHLLATVMQWVEVE